jgi:hypothetical protein
MPGRYVPSHMPAKTGPHALFSCLPGGFGSNDQTGNGAWQRTSISFTQEPKACIRATKRDSPPTGQGQKSFLKFAMPSRKPFSAKSCSTPPCWHPIQANTGRIAAADPAARRRPEPGTLGREKAVGTKRPHTISQLTSLKVAHHPITTAPSASAAGSACTYNIFRLAVAAPYRPAMMMQIRKNTLI